MKFLKYIYNTDSCTHCRCIRVGYIDSEVYQAKYAKILRTELTGVSKKKLFFANATRKITLFRKYRQKNGNTTN